MTPLRLSSNFTCASDRHTSHEVLDHAVDIGKPAGAFLPFGNGATGEAFRVNAWCYDLTLLYKH